MLSTKEKTEMRPPLQLSCIMRRLELSVNLHDMVYQVMIDILEKHGKKKHNEACRKIVEYLETQPTEMQVVEKLLELKASYLTTM